MAVLEIRRLPPNRHSVFGRPTKESIIRNVAPYHTVIFMKIYRSLTPDRTGCQPFKLGSRLQEAPKTIIVLNKSIHNIKVSAGSGAKTESSSQNLESRISPDATIDQNRDLNF